MKKGTIIGIVIALLAIICVFSACSSYNGLVGKRASAEEAWANVEANYQRRADLIPNFVNTVKGYAAHESQTLEAIVAERANATQPKINFDQLNDQSIAKYQEAQNQINGMFGRLMAISENYPDLKASQNFLALQDELSGTENRITNARRDFNKTVKEYNVALQTFPRNIIASMFGFTPKVMFASDEGADKVPQVVF